MSTNSWISTVEHLIWDLDGTLYPFDKKFDQFIHQRLLTHVAQNRNCSETQAATLLQKLKKEHGSTTIALEKLDLDGEQFFVTLWENNDLSPFISNNPLLSQAFQTRLDYSHSILTNSNSIKSVSKKLQLIGLDPAWFEHIWVSGAIGFHKPDSKAFEHVLNQLDVEPEHTVYIGDRERADIVPAHRLGMRTVKVKNQVNHDEKTLADMVVHDPVEFLELLA